MICDLCFHRCSIAEGGQGFCMRRSVKNGKLVDDPSISALNIDPIEKKPLYHFFPGSRVYSVGFFGCNLNCPFCQNHHISRNRDSLGEKLNPKELVELVISSAERIIAFTYSEPLIHLDYVAEAMERAQAAGLYTVLVSNGTISPKYHRKALRYCDAVNIDLKSTDGQWVEKTLKGNLEMNLNFIESALDMNVHVELTQLIVPEANDQPGQIETFSRWVVDHNPDIPIHFSAYHPAYKFSSAATNPQAVLQAVEMAKQSGAHFVFPGNILGGVRDSICPQCSTLLIDRTGTNGPSLKSQNCPSCNSPIYGKFIDDR
jgi:pyruvate formate lyase activating enzyme